MLVSKRKVLEGLSHCSYEDIWAAKLNGLPPSARRLLFKAFHRKHVSIPKRIKHVNAGMAFPIFGANVVAEYQHIFTVELLWECCLIKVKVETPRQRMALSNQPCLDTLLVKEVTLAEWLFVDQ